MTTSSKNCPQCGAPLPVNAPAGLCPRCVMAMNMATETQFTGEVGPHGTRVLKTAPTPEELADKFPQLEIFELLGRGGMGAVYKARQKELDRIVALKILPPGIGDDPAFAERFAREAKALAKLNHPNIVTLYEFGRADGLFFFLMEFVDGVNLRQLLDSGRVSAREALVIVPQICDALQFAHDQGIVHRDIKPENILMDRRGRVKVADFGLAKLVGMDGKAGSPLPAAGVTTEDGAHGVTRPTGELTEAGKVMGTPQYMAPEQKERPTEVDHRADIYALGVVFYQMLTGELPGQRIEPPSKKVQIDVRLDEIVLRALEKNPERRYEQASVFKTQVENVAETPPQSPDSSKSSEVKFPTPPHWLGYEYKSKRTWFGLPLLHVATGLDPRTGEARKARGIVALGGVATGWLAIGGRAYGGIAFGGIAVGGLAFGGLAAGVFSFGGLGLALVLAIGGLAIAPVAIGGLALGYLAIGGEAFGFHIYDARQHDPETFAKSYREIQTRVFAIMGAIWIGSLGAYFFITKWAKRQTLKQHTSAETNPEKRELVGKETSARWIQMACFAGAIFVFALGIWKLTQFDLKLHEILFGVLLVSILALLLVGLGFLVRPASPFSATVPAQPEIKSRRRRKALWNILLAIGIALILRTFVIGIYYATTDAVSPEVPRGSRVLVWKLTRSFEPGDVIVYKKNNRNLLGRVAGELYDENQRVRDRVLVERQGDLPREILARDVIGKVIFNTRSSILPKSEDFGVNAAQFGPVIEQVVTDAVDFDSGKLLDLPLPHPLRDRDAARYEWFNSKESSAWKRQHGIDAVNGNHALMSADPQLMKLDDKDWDSISADELQRRLLAQNATDSFSDGAHKTFGFETREGGIGILQIMEDRFLPGTATREPGVKIRYKLVQSSGAGAALKPIPPRATELLEETKTLYQTRDASSDPNAENEFREKLRALTREMDSVLAGTLAEPLLKDQKEETVKLQEAIQAKDTTKIKEATERIQSLGRKIEELIDPKSKSLNRNSIPSGQPRNEKNNPTGAQENEFSMTHRAKLGQAVLNASRDFTEEHQWKLNREEGGQTNGTEMVRIEATDLSGKRVTFEDARQANGTAQFTVKVESGSEFSANRIGTAIARRLRLAAGWPQQASEDK